MSRLRRLLRLRRDTRACSFCGAVSARLVESEAERDQHDRPVAICEGCVRFTRAEILGRGEEKA